MLVHGKACWLHDKNVRSAHVFHHLDVDFAVRKARDRRFAAFHGQESANLVGQGLIGGAAEDLELIIRTSALRLVLALWLHLLLFLFRFFRCCRYRRHGFFTPYELVCCIGAFHPQLHPKTSLQLLKLVVSSKGSAASGFALALRFARSSAHRSAHPGFPITRSRAINRSPDQTWLGR